MTDAPLISLYQELILEHYRHPRNKGELAEHTAEAHVANPVCGDQLTVWIRLDGDRIEEIAFDGDGCAISQASVSMMTVLVKGRDRSEAIGLADLFTDMMHGSEEASSDRSLGDLRALQGVSKFPVRIRCAILAFDALRDVLSSGLEPDPTGGPGPTTSPKEGEHSDASA